MYFGVLQWTSVNYSVLQLNSVPRLASSMVFMTTFCFLDCDALSEVSTSSSWQFLLLFLSLLVGLVFILFPYFYLVAVFFVLCIFFLSYSSVVTFNIQIDFAVCVFCYHVFPLPLRIARFSVVSSHSCVWDSLSRVLLSHPVVALLIFGQPSISCSVFTSFFRAMSYTIFRCKVSDSGARQGHTSCFARKKSK